MTDNNKGGYTSTIEEKQREMASKVGQSNTKENKSGNVTHEPQKSTDGGKKS